MVAGAIIGGEAGRQEPAGMVADFLAAEVVSEEVLVAVDSLAAGVVSAAAAAVDPGKRFPRI